MSALELEEMPIFWQSTNRRLSHKPSCRLPVAPTDGKTLQKLTQNIIGQYGQSVVIKHHLGMDGVIQIL